MITNLPPLRSQSEIDAEMEYGEPSKFWVVLSISILCLAGVGIAHAGMSFVQVGIEDRLGHE